MTQKQLHPICLHHHILTTHSHSHSHCQSHTQSHQNNKIRLFWCAVFVKESHYFLTFLQVHFQVDSPFSSQSINAETEKLDFPHEN